MSTKPTMTERVAAQIAPLNGGITLTYGEETHWMPTIGHAIGAVGAILLQG